jgi:hypothetical protein
MASTNSGDDDRYSLKGMIVGWMRPILQIQDPAVFIFMVVTATWVMGAHIRTFAIGGRGKTNFGTFQHVSDVIVIDSDRGRE